ncbi:MAG: hypothetical protein ACM3ML_11055 [Micromonosporaceae bacterium]
MEPRWGRFGPDLEIMLLTSAEGIPGHRVTPDATRHERTHDAMV